MMPRFVLVLVAALLMTGCDHLEKRCARVNLEEMYNRLLSRARNRYDEQTPEENLADALGSRRSRDSLAGADSIELRRISGDTGPVVAKPPDVPPPPRPSDVAWYNEHCSEGHPR